MRAAVCWDGTLCDNTKMSARETSNTYADSSTKEGYNSLDKLLTPPLTQHFALSRNMAVDSPG